jgi:hypothetical protein
MLKETLLTKTDIILTLTSFILGLIYLEIRRIGRVPFNIDKDIQSGASTPKLNPPTKLGGIGTSNKSISEENEVESPLGLKVSPIIPMPKVKPPKKDKPKKEKVVKKEKVEKKEWKIKEGTRRNAPVKFLIDGEYYSLIEIEQKLHIPISTLRNYVCNEEKFMEVITRPYINIPQKRAKKKKFSIADKRLMLKYYREGKTYQQIGDKFDAIPQSVGRIIRQMTKKGK